MEKSQDQQRILSQRKLLTLMYKAIMCSAGLQDSFSQNRQIASHGPRGFMAFPKGGDGKLLKKPKISTAIAIRELLKRGPRLCLATLACGTASETVERQSTAVIKYFQSTVF
jgi:hypothetical protein